jgi:hypothetical protein
MSAVEAWNRICENEELDLPTAYKALAEVIQRHRKFKCPNTLQTALQKYLRAGERLRERFSAGSEHATSAAKSGLMLLSGELRQYLHQNQPIVREAKALISDDYSFNVAPSLDELLAEYARLANLFVKIDRHLTS